VISKVSAIPKITTPPEMIVFCKWRERRDSNLRDRQAFYKLNHTPSHSLRFPLWLSCSIWPSRDMEVV